VGALRPFWYYYGGKWAAARWYPAPRYDTIIEPFAGAAGYSCHYPDRRVILVDRSPIICGIWRWLIRVEPAEVLAIPDIPEGGTVDDLPCCAEGRWLAGFWCNDGGEDPRRKPTGWAANKQGMYGWSEKVRERIARQVPRIRHWQVIEGDYREAPEIEATWHVDPPYQITGYKYPYRPAAEDYAALGDWCRTLRGQVMVCEQEGARWLPFVPMAEINAAKRKDTKQTGCSREVVWPGEGTQVRLFA
jgi:site-specific DNA-adenine methylase